MRGFLSPSHAPVTDNYNLANKPYFCLGLLFKLAYLLIPVDAISTILGIFDPFSHSLHGIPLVKLDDCWAKQNLFKSDMFLTPSEAGSLITWETGVPSMDGIFCLCGTYYNGVDLLLLFSGVTIGTWVGVFMVSYSIYGVNQVSLRSIWSGVPLCELHFKRFFQFGGYFAFPHECNCGKFIIKHHMILQWDMNICWV